MRAARKPKEESLQIAVSTYLKFAYPNLIFTAESSGLKLTQGQAVKAAKQRSSRGLPDLWIDEPKGQYHGLRLELKKAGESPFRQDGKLKKKTITKPNGEKYDHYQEQAQIIDKLRGKGYMADFATGFDQAKAIIDAYMRLQRD